MQAINSRPFQERYYFCLLCFQYTYVGCPVRSRFFVLLLSFTCLKLSHYSACYFQFKKETPMKTELIQHGYFEVLCIAPEHIGVSICPNRQRVTHILIPIYLYQWVVSNLLILSVQGYMFSQSYTPLLSLNLLWGFTNPPKQIW